MPMVVLTGATRGIGRAAAVELARRGAEVAVVGRDADRVQEVADEAGAHGHVADLAQMDDVRRLAGELLDRYPRIDVLANNAGAMFTSRHVTSDGFEQTFALNHLSPFLLTSLLRDRLVESRARVVTTSSDAHRGGLLDFDDLQSEHSRFQSDDRLRHHQALQHPLHSRAPAPRARAARQLLPPGRDPHRLRQERRTSRAREPDRDRAVPGRAEDRRQAAR